MRAFRPCTVVFALLVAGCGAGSSQPPVVAGAPPAADGAGNAPVVTAQELTGPQGTLVLAEIRLLMNGKPGLVLHPDGTVEIPAESRFVGRLERDGRFLAPTGELIAKLTDDGEVVVGEDHYLPVVVEKDGSLKLLKEGRTARLRPDGTIEGANPEAPTVTIEGADERTRRTAMFLLVLASYPTARKP